MVDLLTHAYAADIVKSERDDNGDLLVYGQVTGTERDLDGQRCDPSWLRTALPSWMEWGNIRQMHQPIAAGVGIELTSEGDDWYLKSLCVDRDTATKIEKKVLKGYSIGVKGPHIDIRNGQEWIDSGVVCEVSYVDRPAYPKAKMAICKMAGGAALEPVEAADAEVRVIPTPKDLAERLSKAASSISSAQDLAARLGKAADTATSEEDSPEPAVDPPAEKSAVTSTNFPPVSTLSTAGNVEVVYTTATTGTEHLAKALADEFQRRGMDVDKGAMAPIKPGGPPRYPINSVADLKDAIQAFGRAKGSDKAKVKAHIKSEAKRLGASNLIPDNWKALLVKDAAAVDGTGDDWTHDPAELRSVLSGLVDCMKAELDELVAGDNELWDLTQLLSSISGFCCWWSSEAAGGETESPYTEDGSMAELAATPDTTKTVEADVETPTETPEAPVEKTVEPEETKTAEADKTPEPSSEEHLAELVKSAVADATKGLTTAAEEREAALAKELDAVKADLQKVLALPEPGGPVITRTAAQAAVAREQDSMEMHAAVAELRKKADLATDPTLRRGYKERADAIMLKIA